MPVYFDQISREVFLSARPQRIVSVVPSQTELLYDLGLEEEVVGITKFCIHPDRWFRTKTRVGGTKKLRIDEIKALKPDLILANKEENVQEQIEELAKDMPVWVSDITTLEESLYMIRSVGELTATEGKAGAIIKQVEGAFAQLPEVKSLTKTAYLIWREPYMTVGGDTFINDMLYRAGFQNLFAGQCRYPQVTIEELRDGGCEVLLLSSEPYPFSQKHIDELKPLLPTTRILLVDGELFSWYGSRLAMAPEYFMQLRHQLQALSLS